MNSISRLTRDSLTRALLARPHVLRRGRGARASGDSPAARECQDFEFELQKLFVEALKQHPRTFDTAARLGRHVAQHEHKPTHQQPARSCKLRLPHQFRHPSPVRQTHHLRNHFRHASESHTGRVVHLRTGCIRRQSLWNLWAQASAMSWPLWTY